MCWSWILRKAPSLRNNNGALQVRVRLEGKDHFINRLGRWDDPIAVAKAQAISAEIWRDYREGTLDWSLSCYKPLVEGKDPELLTALEELMVRKRQGRTTHAYRVFKRYGGQGLLEVCPSRPGSLAAATVFCAGTALQLCRSFLTNLPPLAT